MTEAFSISEVAFTIFMTTMIFIGSYKIGFDIYFAIIIASLFILSYSIIPSTSLLISKAKSYRESK